jgi:hypothetical protein
MLFKPEIYNSANFERWDDSAVSRGDSAPVSTLDSRMSQVATVLGKFRKKFWKSRISQRAERNKGGHTSLLYCTKNEETQIEITKSLCGAVKTRYPGEKCSETY